MRGVGTRGAVVAVLVALATATTAWAAPAQATGAPAAPAASVTVGPPGYLGRLPVTVALAGVAAGTPASVAVRVDTVFGPPAATASSVPATVTIDAPPPGRHTVVATVRIGHRVVTTASRFTSALRLDQIQALGTHNSYHVAPSAPPFSNVEAWQYTHPPLDVQLESEGARQLELDVYADPNGIRVLHVTDFDTGTNCATLVVCLQTIKAWSDAHPQHVAIAIQIELKDDSYGGPTPVLVWDGPNLDRLDAEIRSVFPPEQVITPDDVRGTAPTLPAALATRGWPTVDATRGKVLFTMDNDGVYRDRYLAGHPVLQGREIFTNSTYGQPDAAFIKLNNPKGDRVGISYMVAAGYVVRTMADGDTTEARTNDTSSRDAALVSGATWVSTDYPVPGNPFGTPYFVSIPGGTPARCNPINAPSWCTPAMVEQLP